MKKIKARTERNSTRTSLHFLFSSRVKTMHETQPNPHKDICTVCMSLHVCVLAGCANRRQLHEREREREKRQVLKKKENKKRKRKKNIEG